MSGFKIICRDCGKEVIIRQMEQYHDCRGDIVIRSDEDENTTVECLCGNEVIL